MFSKLKNIGKPITIIVLLFLVSAGIRASFAVSGARAEQSELPTPTPDEKDPSSVANTLNGRNPSTVLAEVLRREKLVAEREEEIKERYAQLSDYEQQVKQQIVALKEADENLRSTIAFAETAGETDLEMLTQVYENMKPKEAVELFEAMAPDFSAGFLSRMRPEIAAQILSGLTPEKAYSISAILAGKNANLEVTTSKSTTD